MPGGHVEPGERVEAALVRELHEELGAEANVMGFVGAVEYAYTDDGADHHEINFVFEVALADPDPSSREDHLEFHWLSWEQLPGTDVRPGSLRDALVSAAGDDTPFWHPLRD